MIELLVAMMLSGSGAFALWRLQLIFTRERFSARWQYGLLKAALVFFLLPVGAVWAALPGTETAESLPPAVSIPADTWGMDSPGSAEAGPVEQHLAEAAAALELRESGGKADWRSGAVPALRVLWLVGGLSLGGWEAVQYLRFRRRFLLHCRAAAVDCSPLGRRVRAAVSPLPCSPFVTGLVRPVIVLPEGEIPPEELALMLRHEGVHIRRRDLWVRLMALGVRTVYWFDPLAWALYRDIVEWSELSCDEAVTASMDKEERRLYGQVILKSAMQHRENAGGWAAGLAAPETMKRRLLRMIRGTKMRKRTRMAAALVLALLITGGCALSVGTYRPGAEEASALPGGTDAAAPEGTGAPTASSLGAEAPADGERYPVEGPKEREALLDDLCQDYDLGRQDFVIHIDGEDDSEVVEVRRYDAQLEALGAERLVNGDWPRNSRGESYGPECLKEITGSEPDLVSAEGIDGTLGYIRRSDMWDSRFGIRTPEDAEAYMAFITAVGAYTIPLYNAEGEVIGEFPVSGGTPNAQELEWMLREHQQRLGLTDEEIQRYVEKAK